jgi:hypothetical protein
MSRAAQNFRESDVFKVMRSASRAGIAVERFEIERGKITIVPVTVATVAAVPEIAEDALR